MISEATPARRRPQESDRKPVPAGQWLRPVTAHAQARPEFGIFYCETRAGRPRAWHDFDRDGKCIHCGHYSEDADVPIGSPLEVTH